MRRKDREMSRDFGLSVIDKAAYGTLSVTDADGMPYSVALSIVRNGDNLFFHSAKAGTKVDLLQNETQVCITFVTDVKIPELYSKAELEQMRQDESKAAELARRVFTTEYASAIVRGKIYLVRDNEQKRRALQLICQKYTPDKMDLFDMAAKSSMNHTNIYRITIDEITAKRKKYDSEGVEMKWGRM